MRLDPNSLRKQLTIYENRLKQEPNDPELIFNVALRYHLLDNYSTASELYTKLVKLYPNNLKAIIAYAAFLLKWGKNELALEQLTNFALTKLDYSGPNYFLPNFRDILLRSAVELSLESYKSQIELALTHGLLLVPIGLFYAILGRETDMEEYFYKALNLSPTNPLIYLYKGIAELQLDKLLDAIKNFRKALDFNDSLELAHFLLGHCYMRQKVTALARKHLRRAIELNPRNDLALVTYGKFLYNLTNFEDALDIFRKALRVNSKNWQTYYYMALCFKETYEYDSARKLLKEAVELNPHSYEALTELSEILISQGEWKESIEVLKKLIKLVPMEWEPYYRLSVAYERVGLLKEAKEAIERAYQLNPEDFQISFSLGILSFKTGDYETAKKALQKASQLNPRDLHSKYYLGLIHLREEQYQKAIEYLEDALRINPNKTETRYYLGMMYALDNKLDKAIKLYEEALKRQPDNPLLKFNLGAAYAREGKIIEAERQLLHALKNFKPASERELEVFSTLTLQVKVNIEAAELRKRLYRAYLQTVISLAKLIDAKDKYTQGHTFRVAQVSYRIGKQMKLEPKVLEGLHIGAWLHDIGKIGIPDSILNKPGKLTPEEYEIMKSHTIIGAKAIENVDFPWPGVVSCVKYHHERCDGSGYPEGLKGEQIPLPARIIAVADVFDALVTKRPYKPPLPPHKAITLIEKAKGKHFDPRVVDAFLEIVDEIIFEFYAGITGDEDFSIYIESFKDISI